MQRYCRIAHVQAVGRCVRIVYRRREFGCLVFITLQWRAEKRRLLHGFNVIKTADSLTAKASGLTPPNTSSVVRKDVDASSVVSSRGLEGCIRCRSGNNRVEIQRCRQLKGGTSGRMRVWYSMCFAFCNAVSGQDSVRRGFGRSLVNRA